VLIETRPVPDPELSVLLTAQQREEPDAAGAGGEAVFLVAVLDGRAVACGAWQPLPDGAAELRQLYVRPAFRGRGIARQLVVALEEEALAEGRPVIRLTAGSPAVVALFQSSGYRQIPAHGPPGRSGICFEKRLGALVQ
jgi:GNAT superfamily N-acetyltransferase